jgi:ribonuclease BN (tRNA processing enzyme)
LLDCGPGVLPRLRAQEGWPEVAAIAITHFHLDHWGDLVPWTWGGQYGPGRDAPRAALWVPPNGTGELHHFGNHFGTNGMFEEAFDLHEYSEGEPFEAAGFEVIPHRVLHYDLLAFGFRASANGTVVGYSGDSGPNASLAEIARDADLFVCEATLLQPNPEGGTRGHLSADEALEASEAGGAKRLLLTHRPSERPLENGFELARDGLEIDLG